MANCLTLFYRNTTTADRYGIRVVLNNAYTVSHVETVPPSNVTVGTANPTDVKARLPKSGYPALTISYNNSNENLRRLAITIVVNDSTMPAVSQAYWLDSSGNDTDTATPMLRRNRRPK
jgi:hypothetical protein